MDKKLYVATDLDGGDLLGAVWATSEDEAYDYFNNDAPMIPDQMDNLYVELASDAGYSFDDLVIAFPELGDEDGGGKRGNLIDRAEYHLKEEVEPAQYEIIAARALHFMRVNCDMEYVDIADELGIDVQEVLDLIGQDSYDDSDIMLEDTHETTDADAPRAEAAVETENSYRLTESYRRTVSRGKSLNENELFVDFE